MNNISRQFGIFKNRIVQLGLYISLVLNSKNTISQPLRQGDVCGWQFMAHIKWLPP